MEREYGTPFQLECQVRGNGGKWSKEWASTGRVFCEEWTNHFGYAPTVLSIIYRRALLKRDGQDGVVKKNDKKRVLPIAIKSVCSL